MNKKGKIIIFILVLVVICIIAFLIEYNGDKKIVEQYMEAVENYNQKATIGYLQETTSNAGETETYEVYRDNSFAMVKLPGGSALYKKIDEARVYLVNQDSAIFDVGDNSTYQELVTKGIPKRISEIKPFVFSVNKEKLDNKDVYLIKYGSEKIYIDTTNYLPIQYNFSNSVYTYTYIEEQNIPTIEFLDISNI